MSVSSTSPARVASLADVVERALAAFDQRTKSLRVARNAFAPHRVLCAAFGAVALSFATAQVHAAGEAKSTTVQYADLDLSKQEDVRALYGRLRQAAEKVCGRYAESRDLGMRRREQACYEDALARAVDAVDHAAVKAMYRADGSIRIATRRTGTQPQS